MLIVTFLSGMTALGLHRLVFGQHESRAATGGVLLTLASIGGAMAAANYLTVVGLLDRDGFLTFFHLSVVVGVFVVVLIHLNTSGEPTTFMAKIIGVSLLTFLLLFQFVAYFAMRDLERQYDADRARDVRLLLVGQSARDDVQYVDTRTFGATQATFVRSGHAAHRPRPPQWEAESRNTLLLERIRAQYKVRPETP